MTHRVNQQLRLFLLYDRRTTAEPETTGAAGPSGQLPSPRAAAVAVPPQTISGRAGQPNACARDPWCFPTIPPLPPALLRSPPADSLTSSVQVRVRDPVLEFDKGKGSNCEVCDSNE